MLHRALRARARSATFAQSPRGALNADPCPRPALVDHVLPACPDHLRHVARPHRHRRRRANHPARVWLFPARNVGDPDQLFLHLRTVAGAGRLVGRALRTAAHAVLGQRAVVGADRRDAAGLQPGLVRRIARIAGSRPGSGLAKLHRRHPPLVPAARAWQGQLDLARRPVSRTDCRRADHHLGHRVLRLALGVLRLRSPRHRAGHRLVAVLPRPPRGTPEHHARRASERRRRRRSHPARSGAASARRSSGRSACSISSW